MFSKINSIYLRGMEEKNVTVEADVSDGLPGLILVGYLASEVREGGDRVRTAIKNLGLSSRQKRSRSTCPRQILERKGPDSTSRSPLPFYPPTVDFGRKISKTLSCSENWGWTGLFGEFLGLWHLQTRHGKVVLNVYFYLWRM